MKGDPFRRADEDSHVVVAPVVVRMQPQQGGVVRLGPPTIAAEEEVRGANEVALPVWYTIGKFHGPLEVGHRPVGVARLVEDGVAEQKVRRGELGIFPDRVAQEFFRSGVLAGACDEHLRLLVETKSAE